MARPLTAREQEAAKLIAEGYSSKQIAGALVISEKIAKSNRANALRSSYARPRGVNPQRDPPWSIGGPVES